VIQSCWGYAEGAGNASPVVKINDNPNSVESGIRPEEFCNVIGP